MTRIFFRAISYDFPPPPDVSPRPGIFPEDDRSGSALVRIAPFFPHPLPGSITLLGDYRDDFPPTLGGTASRGLGIGDMYLCYVSPADAEAAEGPRGSLHRPRSGSPPPPPAPPGHTPTPAPPAAPPTQHRP